MKNYRGLQNGWWLMALQSVIMFAGSFLIASFFPQASGPALILSELLLVIPMAAGFLLIKSTFPFGRLSDNLGLKGFSPVLLLFAIVLPLSASFFTAVVTAPLQVVLNTLFGEYTPGIGAPANMAEFGMLFLVLCVLAPVIEELIFRGVLYRLFEPYGSVAAVLFTALAFALIHFDIRSFVPILVLGLLLGLLRCVSRSVWPGVFFHAFNNFYSLLALTLPLEKLKGPGDAAALLLAAAFPLLLLLFFKTQPEPGCRIKPHARLRVSVGLILCAAGYLIFQGMLMLAHLMEQGILPLGF